MPVSSAVGPEFLAAHGGVFDAYVGDAAVATVDPCADVPERPCDAPVLSSGTDLWFLRRTATRREIVRQPLGGARSVELGGAIADAPDAQVVDFAVGSALSDGRRVLYVIQSADPSTGRGRLIRTTVGPGPTVRAAGLAADVYEVAATSDGRVAWVSAAGLSVMMPGRQDVTTIPLDERPSQLSFGPNGSSFVLARTGDDRRVVIDIASTAAAPMAFGATAACWTATGSIVAYAGSRAAPAPLLRVDPRTGAVAPLTTAAFATEQIACAATGTVALVDHVDGAPTGVLVLVHGDGSVGRVAGAFDRVRSLL